MDIEEETAHRELSLEAAKDKNAARALGEYMSEISEEYYCAGWLIDLEYDLWKVLEGQPSTSFKNLEPQEIARLRELRTRAGGWWYLDGVWGELFETTEAFSARFKARTGVLP